MTTSSTWRIARANLADYAALLLALTVHVVAVFTLVPVQALLSSDPIYGADHPAHAHRVHVYRRALENGAWPWGYDPAVCAGSVMRPTQDAGAKPQQFLGVLFARASEGQIVKWFLFATALLMPLWMILAARQLGLSLPQASWAVAVLVMTVWCYGSFAGFLRWGLSAFAFGAFLGPLVLALFLSFTARPTWARYATAVAALSLQAMMHVLGPVLIAPVMLVVTAFDRKLSSRWRLAAFGAPLIVAAVNLFWLAPFLLDFKTPSPPQREFTTFPADLVYTSWEHMRDMLSIERIVGLLGAVALASWGLRVMHSTCGAWSAFAFGASAAIGLFLKFFGSFLPVIVDMQPARFLLAAFVMLTIPLALALCDIARRVRCPNVVAVCAFMALVLGVSFWKDHSAVASASANARQHVNFAGQSTAEVATTVGLPRSVPLPALVEPLKAFVLEKTRAGERLLVQTAVQCEPKILAAVLNREVVGNNYPDQHDPANFVRDQLWGRRIKDWRPEDLRESLDRWGIVWAFTWTKPATDLLQAACGRPPISVGQYSAFRVSDGAVAVLQGRADVETDVNFIRLTGVQADHGLVVLRYRFHPAWEAIGATLEPYAIPEDPSGFIALRDPSDRVELHFRPERLFFADWPDAMAEGAKPMDEKRQRDSAGQPESSGESAPHTNAKSK